MTPNVGLGGNSSMESVAVLANLLNKSAKQHRNGKPDAAALESLLVNYQAQRCVRMQQVIDFSGLATKVQAWDNIWYRALSRIMPLLPDNTMALQAGKLIKAASKLDYVPLPDDMKGTVKWDDDELEELDEKSKRRGLQAKSLLSWARTPLLSMCVLLSFFWLISPRFGD
jgi:FAD dependent monooxygenase